MSLASTFITRMKDIWNGRCDIPPESTFTRTDWENAYHQALDIGGKFSGVLHKHDGEYWALFFFPDGSACWVMESGKGTKELVFQ